MSNVLPIPSADRRRRRDDLVTPGEGMGPPEDALVRTMRVTNGLGLHARVATRLVQLLQNYSCQVTFTKDDMEVDARSVLGLLLLAAAPGTVVVARATGKDAREALEDVSRLIEHEDS